MKRLLLVAPHFAPVNAPDGQRARLLLPHLHALGWDCTVLAVAPEDVAAPREDALLATLPPGADIRRVRATLGLRAGRRLGIGNLGWRALPALAREGSRLLREERFDLVYFSTTQFICLPLGRRWLRRFGVPFVVDLQDPWLNDYYSRPGAPRPPGGWKYRVASALAACLEGRTLRHAAHVVSVSPRYLEDLARRYPGFGPGRGTVIPFGWSLRDQECAAAMDAEPPAPAGSPPTVLYLGRVGPDMRPALDHLFRGYAAWRRARPAAPRIRWCFTGTSYDPRSSGDGPARTAALAAGVADDVEETPGRLGYLQALARMRGADANLILGSEDAAYSPSKIWPLLAAGRPWLAVTAPDTVLARQLQLVGQPGGRVAPLGAPDPSPAAAGPLHEWLDELAAGRTAARTAPSPGLLAHEAKTLAARHTALFDSLLAHGRP